MKKKIQISTSSLLIKSVFSVGLLIAIINCAGEKGDKAGQTISVGSLPASEQQEVISYSDIAIGETSLLTETELNPLLIEQYINKINEAEILTARAPNSSHILLKEINEPEELLNESDIKEMLSESRLEEFVRIFNYVEHMGKSKYEKLLKLFSSGALDCFKRGKGSFQGSYQSNPMKVDGTLSVQNCTIGEYNISGTVGIYIEDQLLHRFTLNNLKFGKDGKYVNFVTGNIEISSVKGEDGTVTNAIKISNTSVDDTEEELSISVTTATLVVKITGSEENREILLTRDVDISWIKEGKISSLKGTLSVIKKKSRENLIFSASVTGPDGKFIAIYGDEKAKVKIVHERIKSEDPKGISVKLLADVDFSSPASSFSISAIRTRAISKEKTPDGKTFSLNITNQISVNGALMRSYSHSVTVVKENNGAILNGSVQIVKKDRTRINITLSNVKIENGCTKPTGGTIKAEIEDSKKVKVISEFAPGCVCEHKVEVEKDGKTIIIDKANICSAGEKAKSKMYKEMTGSS